MTFKYETNTNELGKVDIIRTDSTGLMAAIPADPANSDYQTYLRWLENPDAEQDGTLS